MTKSASQAFIHRPSSIIMFRRSSRVKSRQIKKSAPAIRIIKPITETRDQSVNFYYFEFALSLIVTLLVIILVHPQSIARFPFPHAFLALHLPIFLTTSSFFLIVIHQKFLSYLLSLTLQTILFLKLNDVIIVHQVWIVWLLCALSFSGLSMYMRYRQHNYRL